MTNNVNQVSIMAPTYTFWSKLYQTYPYGITGTIANGAGAGMGRLRGVNQVNITIPQAGAVTPVGDNSAITVFTTNPTELPSGAISIVVLNQDFAAAANGVKVYTDGDWDEVGDFPLCYSFADLGFVFNCPANSQDSGSIDEAGWNVYEVYKVQTQASILAQMQSGQAVTFPNNTRCKRASKNFAGRSFSSANDGSTAFVMKQYWSDYPVTYHTYIGDNSTTTVTLDETPAAASGSAVQLWQADTKKTYTSDYTVSTSTKVLTFGTAPGTGVKAVAKYKFVPTC